MDQCRENDLWLAREIVQQDGPRITEGGYAAEYLFKELTSNDFFSGCDTAFDTSVWAVKANVRGRTNPETCYLTVTGSVHESSSDGRLSNAFKASGTHLSEYRYDLNHKDKRFEFYRTDSEEELSGRLEKAYRGRLKSAERPWTDENSRPAREKATKALEELLGPSRFMLYAANRYLANQVLTRYSPTFLDLDRVGLVNNRLLALELKRKYPAANRTFGLDHEIRKAHTEFQQFTGGLSAYIVNHLHEYGKADFNEKKSVIPHMSGPNTLYWLRLDTAQSSGELTTPANSASSFHSHKGKDRQQISFPLEDFTIFKPSSPLVDLLSPV